VTTVQARCSTRRVDGSIAVSRLFGRIGAQDLEMDLGHVSAGLVRSRWAAKDGRALRTSATRAGCLGAELRPAREFAVDSVTVLVHALTS